MSGFNWGVVQELGRCKANVVLAANRTELHEEIADTIRASGGSRLVGTMDISKPEDVQQQQKRKKEYTVPIILII